MLDDNWITTRGQDRISSAKAHNVRIDLERCHRLTMLATFGSRTDRHCFRSDVGIESRSQYLSEEEIRAFATSS